MRDEEVRRGWQRALALYKALVAFRENQASDNRGEELVKKAWKANCHIPAVLVGTKKAKPSTNGYVTMGGEDEAAHYVEEWRFDWLTTPGAIDRLTRILRKRVRIPHSAVRIPLSDI